jgi:hypothetical protein
MLDHEAYYDRQIDTSDVVTLFHLCHNLQAGQMMKVLRIARRASDTDLLAAPGSRETYLRIRNNVLPCCAGVDAANFSICTLREYYQYKKDGIQCDEGATPLFSLDLRRSVSDKCQRHADYVLNNLVGLDRVLNFYDVNLIDLAAIHLGSIRSFHGLPTNFRGMSLTVDWSDELAEAEDGVPRNVQNLTITNFRPANHHFIRNNFEAFSSAGHIVIYIDLSRGIRSDELIALLELSKLVKLTILPAGHMATSNDDTDETSHCIIRIGNALANGFCTGIFETTKERVSNLTRQLSLDEYAKNGFRPLHQVGRIDCLKIITELTRCGAINS